MKGYRERQSDPVDPIDMPKGPGFCEREAWVYGAHIKIYARTNGGFRRIKFEFDEGDETLRFYRYFSDDEFVLWHAAFAPDVTYLVASAQIIESAHNRWMADFDESHQDNDS